MAEKRAKRVTKGKVVIRKKKQNSAFEDSLHSAGSYILNDVIIPTAKDMLSEAITGATDQILFGGERKSSARKKAQSHISYNKISTERNRVRPTVRRSRGAHDFSQYLLESRAEAEEVLDALYHILDQYETVTVSDFKDCIGVTGNHIDDNWGWERLNGARIIRVNGGFTFDLPDPIQINR